MKKLLSVLFLLSFTLASVYAQNIQVKGTVEAVRIMNRCLE